MTGARHVALVFSKARLIFAKSLLFMCETIFNGHSYYRAALVPEAAVFQRISDLSKTLRQPPRQEKLQYINTKSFARKTRFLGKIEVLKMGF